MAKQEASMISLDEAKQLVALLEQGKGKEADALIRELHLADSVELFDEVGKLTRQLHDSLQNFQLEERISNLANEDIPDAHSRLSYVIDTTEQAANRTMDAVEACMPISEQFVERTRAIMPEWQKLMSRDLHIAEFKSLCHDVDSFLHYSLENSEKLNSLLTEVLMAQGYQDITGQIIRRVMELVKEVESSLVHMLTMFSMHENVENTEKSSQEKSTRTDTIKAEGPIIDAENRDDVVSGQDDVDDLLSSLGF